MDTCCEPACSWPEQKPLFRNISLAVSGHLRMSGDINSSGRGDGRDALPVALDRILDRVIADNPITTVPQGLFHFEIRTYPELALREALLNAFVHADYRIHGPVMVKQLSRRTARGHHA